MKNALFGAVAFALVGFAIPASATIVISGDNVATDENVQFNDDGFDYTDVNPLLTLTNKGTGITFIGTEPMTGEAGGQARIVGSDGGLDYLEYVLTDAGLGFKTTEFNINVPNGGGTDEVTITMYDQFGGMYQLVGAELGNGENRFGGTALDDQFIVRVVISTNGPTDDIRQVRLGGVGAIPEPATWAMLISGFGLVGMSMRKRRATLAHVSA